MTKHMDFEGERQHTDSNEREKLRVVGVQYVPTLDVEARISRAITILLKAAARGTNKSEDSIKGKKPGDGLTNGERKA